MNNPSLQFHLDTELNLVDSQEASQRVLEISLQAPPAADQSIRPQLNLALVLDRSGSMSGDKLDYVKQAAKHVLDLLQETDRVALVDYDDEINLLSPSTAVTAAVRSELKSRISQLKPGGSTNLSGGWLAGCQEAAAAAREGTLNRSLLLTDGLANAGITDLEELARHARELARRGISTSTFGVGNGFNEHLLEAMSNMGGGNFYYIESPIGIPDLFLREFKELVAVTARDVEIILEVPPQVSARVLGGWQVEATPGQVRIFLGNLFSGQAQQIHIVLQIPPAGQASQMTLKARLYAKGETGDVFEDQAELTYRSADGETVRAAPLKREVMERFALVDLAESANEALKLEREGQNQKASALLLQAIERNRPYLDASQVEKYQRMAARMEHGMDEADRKSSHYATCSLKRHRE